MLLGISLVATISIPVPATSLTITSPKNTGASTTTELILVITSNIKFLGIGSAVFTGTKAKNPFSTLQ